MSALVALPDSWRVYALGKGATNVDAMWASCFEWHVSHAKDVTQTAWEKWVQRERTKVEVPKIKLVIGSTAPTPGTLWKEPAEWAQAAKLDPDRKVGIAACKTILGMLDAMGGTPTKLDAAPARGTHTMVIDPVCAKCGRLASNGAGSMCGRSDCKDSGAPASAEALSSPECDVAKTSSGDQPESEQNDGGHEARREQTEAGDEAFCGL